MCFIRQLQLRCIPRQKLKGQLETPFQGVQLVHITAETSISVVISWAEFLLEEIRKEKKKKQKQEDTTLELEFFHCVKWK